MIRQPYPFWIAIRYLGARGRGGFISFISLVSMIGIALAVAILITVMSVINGFETELERRILGVSADVSVFGFDAPLADWEAMRTSALRHDDVLAAAPFVEGQGMVSSGDALLGVNVRGVHPELELEVSNLADWIGRGSMDSLMPGSWNVVIGSALAEELGVDLGDEIVLVLSKARVTPAGLSPALRSLNVSGIFDVGMSEFDRGLIVVSFQDAAALFRTAGRASGVSFAVNDIYAVRSLATELAQSLVDELGGRLYVRDWMEQHENVFRSIQLTKPILFIMLSLVVAVATFNIVSTLVMVVREKRGDVAILRSFGASPRGILSVFTVQGAAIGVIGTLVGLAIGLFLVAYLGNIVGFIEAQIGIDLLSAEAYLIGDLATEARFAEVAQVCLIAFGLAILATIYPASLAARQPPAEALRYE